MNTFKKNGGFTLVELIIVIAILAILSSVAVAGYSTYIKSANDSAVETFANDVKTHATLANAEAGAITSVTFTYTKATDKVEVKISAALFAKSFATDFKNAYTGTDFAAYKADGTKLTGEFAITDVAYYKFTYDAPSAWAGSNYNKATEQTIPADN